MRRAIIAALLAGTLLTATGCGEEGLQVGGASELADRAREAAEQVEGRIEGGDGQQADTGGDEAVTQPEETQTTDASEAASTLVPLLLLVALVVLVVAVIIGWLRRRANAAAARRRLRDDALLEADWLIDAASEQPSYADAAARARDVRVRTDRLTDGLRRLEGMSGRRVTEAAAALRSEATALARSVIARLDDVATGRPGGDDLDIDALVDRTRFARDQFIDAS